MTTYDGVGFALMVGASGTMIVLAAVVVLRSRRGSVARLFGIAVDHPWHWAAAAACMGIRGVLWMAAEGSNLTPGGWQKPIHIVDGVLLLAFFVLLATYLFRAHRTKRRRARQQQTTP